MKNQHKPLSLHELQVWMKWIITDPRGVHEALIDPFPQPGPYMERYTSPQKNALPWIADVPPTGKEQRLEIYAEAYFARLLESMNADFPITARCLGELSFQKVVSEYLKEFPSRSTNIGEAGRNFSKFISQYADLQTSHFLEPLAGMEWFFIESFYAENTGVIESSKIASLSDKDWENVIFKLAPSVKIVQSFWPLDDFWRLRDDSFGLENVNFEPLTSSQGFLIVRELGQVSLEKLSGPEYIILEKLNRGKNLASALEEAQNYFPENEIGPHMMNWFNQWVRRGIIYDYKL